jgi:hypothetical protein
VDHVDRMAVPAGDADGVEEPVSTLATQQESTHWPSVGRS